MKNNPILKVILLVASLVLGGLIIAYYWGVESELAMSKVPMHVMVYALVYILAQIARRYLMYGKHWWDWFYYIALIAMLIPIFFSTPERTEMFNYLTDFGTFFFVIPVILDGVELMKKDEIE
ncbi:MAG: hypothetical protein CSA03_03970 [Bacteroidetes bacterium]|nr:MAG: hypothetical protein CSA03_03970 [Bacteroidota bacterium]